MNTTHAAKLFGCTEAQVKAQYLKNAAQLRTMLETSRSTGKKCRGYTETQLAAHIARLENAAK